MNLACDFYFLFKTWDSNSTSLSCNNLLGLHLKRDVETFALASGNLL